MKEPSSGPTVRIATHQASGVPPAERARGARCTVSANAAPAGRGDGHDHDDEHRLGEVDVWPTKRSTARQPLSRRAARRSGIAQMPKTASTSPRKWSISTRKLCPSPPVSFSSRCCRRCAAAVILGREEGVEDGQDEDDGRDEVDRLQLDAMDEELPERHSRLTGVGVEGERQRPARRGHLGREGQGSAEEGARRRREPNGEPAKRIRDHRADSRILVTRAAPRGRPRTRLLNPRGR